MINEGLLEKFSNLNFMKMDRRTFIRAVGVLGASLFLQTYKSDFVKALDSSKTKIFWLHGVEYTGCTVSVLDRGSPHIVEALSHLNLNPLFKESLMMQQGIFTDIKPANISELNFEVLPDEILEKDYILISEGGVPNEPGGSGKYLMLGGRPYKEVYEKVARNASAIVAIGQCATQNGVNAADSYIKELMDNCGIAFSVKNSSEGIVNNLGIDKTVINVNGCPAHPDWVLLTIGAVVFGKIKMPDDLPEVLDKWKRPEVFFFQDPVVHNNCPYLRYYDREEFDLTIGREKCLRKLGCRGSYSSVDCALRHLNGYHSFCPPVSAAYRQVSWTSQGIFMGKLKNWNCRYESQYYKV
jgi:F420-nonreducing hydrogenase I